MIEGYHWFSVKDGDASAFALMSRHYSFQAYQDGRRQRPSNRNRFLFVGPGEKMVLMTADCLALFVWRKFIDNSGQSGVNCAVFRNEGSTLSSLLILEAEGLAWAKWPGERLYTYINASKVKTGKPFMGKPCPGKCFLKAGWRQIGITKVNKLLIFEKLPTG